MPSLIPANRHQLSVCCPHHRTDRKQHINDTVCLLSPSLNPTVQHMHTNSMLHSSQHDKCVCPYTHSDKVIQARRNLETEHDRLSSQHDPTAPVQQSMPSALLCSGPIAGEARSPDPAAPGRFQLPPPITADHHCHRLTSSHPPPAPATCCTTSYPCPYCTAVR